MRKLKVYEIKFQGIKRGHSIWNEDTEGHEFDNGGEKWMDKKTKKMAIFKASYAC